MFAGIKTENCCWCFLLFSNSFLVFLLFSANDTKKNIFFFWYHVNDAAIKDAQAHERLTQEVVHFHLSQLYSGVQVVTMTYLAFYSVSGNVVRRCRIWMTDDRLDPGHNVCCPCLFNKMSMQLTWDDLEHFENQRENIVFV